MYVCTTWKHKCIWYQLWSPHISIWTKVMVLMTNRQYQINIALPTATLITQHCTGSYWMFWLWLNKVVLECRSKALVEHRRRDGEKHWAKKQCPCVTTCVFVCRHVSLYRLFTELILYALLKAVCAKTNLCGGFFFHE